jgi:hypothetical protein
MRIFRSFLYNAHNATNSLTTKLFSDLLFYHFEFKIDRSKPAGQKTSYGEGILDAQQVFDACTVRRLKSLVCLNNGEVIYHEYVKPLPTWVNDPLLRNMVIATKQLPKAENE